MEEIEEASDLSSCSDEHVSTKHLSSDPPTWSRERTSRNSETPTPRVILGVSFTAALLLVFMMGFSADSSPVDGLRLHRELRHRRKSSRSIFFPNFRIVGGDETRKGEHPFIVALYWGSLNGEKPVCGATLISPSVVVTAAHCVYSVTKLELNRHDVRDDTGVNEYSIKAEAKHPHPDYDSDTGDNDIALIKLPTPHPGALPATLHRSGPVPPMLTAIGWGQLKTGGEQPDKLMEVDVKHRTDYECSSKYGTAFNPLTMVCASGDGRDSCQGDSGGPLVEAGSSRLVGITSWGAECASDTYPGVYARVSRYIDWIDDMVCNDLSPEDCVDGRIGSAPDETSDHPSASPSETPSTSPSVSPSVSPSASPSVSPSVTPSVTPSASPSVSPSTSTSPSDEAPSSEPPSISFPPSEANSLSPSESAEPTRSPINLVIMTPSNAIVTELQQNCLNRDSFMVGSVLHDCEWVSQRKDRRCLIYKKKCPQSCQLAGCP